MARGCRIDVLGDRRRAQGPVHAIEDKLGACLVAVTQEQHDRVGGDLGRHVALAHEAAQNAGQLRGLHVLQAENGDGVAWVEATELGGRADQAYLRITGWFPGYADPEYFLRLLFQSDSRTNEGAFSYGPFDELIERARTERSDRRRLELFHEADRMAVADRVACIPLVYGRNMAFVKPWVDGWWEFGKSSSSFADLLVDPSSPRA